MAKIRLSKEVKAKLEAERLERNKIRVFDLMVRIERMNAAGVGGIEPVNFQIHPSDAEDDSIDTELKPGFHVHLKCYDSSDDICGHYVRRVIRIDSEDWEFQTLEEYLDQLQWRADEQKRKMDERNAELRSLSPKQREVLGFGGWRDPLGST